MQQAVRSYPSHAASPGYHAQAGEGQGTPTRARSRERPHHTHRGGAWRAATALPPPGIQPCKYFPGTGRETLGQGSPLCRAPSITHNLQPPLFVSKPLFPLKGVLFKLKQDCNSPHPPFAAPPPTSGWGDGGPGVTCAEGVRHPPGELLRAPGRRESKEPPPEHPSPLPASPVPPTALPSPLPGQGPRWSLAPSELQGGAKTGEGKGGSKPGPAATPALQRWVGVCVGGGTYEDLEGEAGSCEDAFERGPAAQ